MKRIVYLTSGHKSFDDRIFYKFGFSFVNNGYEYFIISSQEEMTTVQNGINIFSFDGSNLKKEKKINNFVEMLIQANPNLIICGEPLPIFAANKYKRNFSPTIKIIYDVTEWYPENVAFKFNGLKRWFEYLKLLLFNFAATRKADGLISGERRKLNRYLLYNPKLPHEIVSYFPPKYFYANVSSENRNELFTIGFTGILDDSRGFNRLLNVVESLSKLTDFEIKLLLVGLFIDEKSKMSFEKFKEENNRINVEFYDYLNYLKLPKILSRADVFLDLRENNFIFRNSLPIKIFEYLSLGKTVIYPDFPLLKNEFQNLKPVHLVDINNTEAIVEILQKYILNRNLLQINADEARPLIGKKYNWEFEEKKLLAFVQSFLKS